ncbi:MAG: hypothetical protein AAB553_06080 [Patescibacteria group bacterium]
MYRKFKDEVDIIRACGKLARKEHLLDVALTEIALQVRGNVKPVDTIRRSEIGRYFSSYLQQIDNYITKHGIQLTQRRKDSMARISYKADKVLRENIVLQAVAPLDVIKFADVPIRHSYSSYGRREQRWGYGLHKKPFNEEGNSVTIADMPPHYIQSIHNHTLSEYSLVLDSRTEGMFFPHGKKEKINTTRRLQILHFLATTPHTLRNPLKTYTRNITYKQPLGLTDWKPVTSLNKVKIERARLIKGRNTSINQTQTHKQFTIKDKYYDYTLEIIKLTKGVTYENNHTFDQYIFVINGKFTITHGAIKKICQKNDYVVIDRNTKYAIETKTACRLYTICS